jgi:hypothetical protein
MLDTFNTSDNLMLNCQGEDTINKIKFLSKGLQYCKPINGNLIFRIIEKIILNSNTVSR